MKAIAGKEIRVIEPTSDFKRMVEKELTVANPEYARKQKMGKWHAQEESNPQPTDLESVALPS